MSALTDMLKRHEGHGPMHNGRFLPYVDTVGKTTIAWGRNLTDTGVREEEAAFMLENDVNDVVAALRSTYPWYATLDACRQDALADMAYNLGMAGFSTFHHMIAAFEQRDYFAAAAAGRDSHWYKQVGVRGEELMKMVETGLYQDGG